MGKNGAVSRDRDRQVMGTEEISGHLERARKPRLERGPSGAERLGVVATAKVVLKAVGSVSAAGAVAHSDRQTAHAARACAPLPPIVVETVRTRRRRRLFPSGRLISDSLLIEQAKGMVAERAGLNMEQAFSALRAYARNHNLRLAAVAENRYRWLPGPVGAGLGTPDETPGTVKHAEGDGPTSSFAEISSSPG
jgi:hypothetical protein